MTPEEELRQKIGDAEFEARLAAKLKDYHQLITREAASYLLSLEAFGPRLRVETLRKAALSASPCLLRVRVERVFEARVFERGMQKSRIQRLAVTDQSGPGTLVLYDAACEQVGQEVLSGDLVEAGPMRLRGDEFHLLPGGNLHRVQKGPREKLVPGERETAGAAGRADGGTAGRASASAIGNFEGMVLEFLGDLPVKKASWKQKTLTGNNQNSSQPEFGLMSAFELKDSSGKCRVVLWDSPGLAGMLKSGMAAEIENGQRRGAEIHIGGAGRLVFAQGAAEEEQKKKQPKIERMEIEMDEANGDKTPVVRVFAGSKIVVFPSLEEACAKLGAGPVPEGVDASTIIELKKKEWVGQPLPAKWEEKK